MARVVVVSSMEIEPGTLGDHVRADDELFVVVPAVQQSRLQWLTNDESEARDTAQQIGETIASDAPAPATDVEVKPDVPSQAVLDAIAEHDPDRIVVVLREGDDASWLEEGELAQVPGQIAGVPVTRVAVS
jgi:hypothetical protein